MLMLRYASWRVVVVLALIGMVCLPAAYRASGQELRVATELEPVSQDDFLPAEPPEGEAEDAGAKPEVAPLPPKKPPPSRPDISPSDRRPRPPARPPARRPDITSMLAARSPMIRLAGLPNMFGDYPFGSRLQVADVSGIDVVDIPPPGGTRRVKISENDKALPMDRVFFSYNHFHNAVEANISGLGTRSFPIDQYTIGLEKTFCDKLWSVELRMPFGTTPRVAGADLTLGAGEVGNLAITFKRLLFMTPRTAIGVGLPIETPTGSDISGEGAASSFALSNDAVHLAPFVGFLNMPTEHVFWEGFLQVDVATHGNRVTFGDSDLGRLPEQSLLYVDLALGYWLYRNRCARFLTGLATMVEYHYTTTLQDAVLVTGMDGVQQLTFGNTFNRMDVSNLTVGLHAELGKTTVRVGGAFPLSGGSNRLYDAEVQVSVNRRF
jgi:hypothetical protein